MGRARRPPWSARAPLHLRGLAGVGSSRSKWPGDHGGHGPPLFLSRCPVPPVRGPSAPGRPRTAPPDGSLRGRGGRRGPARLLHVPGDPPGSRDRARRAVGPASRGCPGGARCPRRSDLPAAARARSRPGGRRLGARRVEVRDGGVLRGEPARRRVVPPPRPRRCRGEPGRRGDDLLPLGPGGVRRRRAVEMAHRKRARRVVRPRESRRGGMFLRPRQSLPLRSSRRAG